MNNRDGALVALACLPMADIDYADQFRTNTPVEWLDFSQISESALDGRIDEIDVIVGMGHGDFAMPDLMRFKNLQAFLSASVGVEGYTPEMIPDGCVVANTFEHERPIADWVIMAATMLSRNAFQADRDFRNGTLNKWVSNDGWFRDLSDSTIGVIGLGHIGNAVIDLANAHSMNCVAVSRRSFSNAEAKTAGLTTVFGADELHELLKISDFVVPTVPLVDETRGLIGASEYRAMKDTAHIINISRAEILDEKATYEALKDGKIAGAALDVWWKEDTAGFESDDIDRKRWANYPFWELPNVLMSPHWSNFTTAMFSNKVRFICRQIDRLSVGEPLENVIEELSSATG